MNETTMPVEETTKPVEDVKVVEKESQTAPRNKGKVEVKKVRKFEDIMLEDQLNKLKGFSKDMLEAQVKSKRTSQVYKDACKKELLEREELRKRLLNKKTDK